MTRGKTTHPNAQRGRPTAPRTALGARTKASTRTEGSPLPTKHRTGHVRRDKARAVPAVPAAACRRVHLPCTHSPATPRSQRSTQSPPSLPTTLPHHPYEAPPPDPAWTPTPPAAACPPAAAPRLRSMPNSRNSQGRERLSKSA